MRYFCTDCSYIYDEALGEQELSVEPGTKMDDMSDFYCPNCEADADMFQPIVEELLYAEDPDNLTSIEKEHIPHIIHIDEKEVEISVGLEIHPMEEEHLITTVSLHDEYGDMLEEHFFEVDEDPIYVFHTEDLDSFEIRACCNQHWVWSTWIIENN